MYRVGIDLGGTTMKVGLFNEQKEMIASVSKWTRVERHWKEIIVDMAQCVKELLKETNAKEEELISIGIGSPGTIDAKRGVVIYSNNFGWNNIELVEELRHHFKTFIPIQISNDANCAALGEVVAGAAKGKQNVILLTLGTGVGSGIILNGSIYEGSYPGAAELGHTILQMDGKKCSCGRKGCLEAYGSATALIQSATSLAIQHPESKLEKLMLESEGLTGKNIFSLAKEGDSLASEVVETYIGYLAEGITNIINTFRPEMVLVAGGVCNANKQLLIPLNDLVAKNTFGSNKDTVAPIVRATLGDQAGIVGAAYL